MTQLVPVSQQGAIWPSYSGTPSRPRGSYWNVRCASCGTEGPTQAKGTCRGCGATLVPALPEVRTPPRGRLPGTSILSVDLLELLPAFVSIPLRLIGRLCFILFFLVAFWPIGLVLLFTNLRDGFGIFGDEKLPEGVHNHVPQQLKVERAWVDVSRLRGRRGLVVQYSLQTHGLIHKRLELAVRVRGPDGRYLPALLRNYRGDRGEVLVRHATKPLKSQSSRFNRMWVFLPLRAIPVPAPVHRMSVVLEAAFACEGRLLSESHHPYTFVPTADDRSDLLLAATTGAATAAPTTTPDHPEDEDAIVVLASNGPAEDTTCGVCGDSLAGEPVARCNLCDSASHKECWEYMQGCSTYACEGRPA